MNKKLWKSNNRLPFRQLSTFLNDFSPNVELYPFIYTTLSGTRLGSDLFTLEI